MIFKINGIKAGSSEEGKFQVEALTQEEAIATALNYGLLPESIKIVNDGLEKPIEAKAPSTADANPPPVNVESPKAKPTAVPPPICLDTIPPTPSASFRPANQNSTSGLFQGISNDPAVTDLLAEWKRIFDRYTKIHSFIKTRNLLLNGAPLWDYSPRQLKSKNLFESWRFNLYQSWLTVIPYTTLLALLGFIGSLYPVNPADTGELITGWEDYWTKTQKIWHFLIPITVPFALGIFSFMAAFGSLEPAHRTRASMSRARRAYLYLDGAYSFWPQMLIPFVQFYYALVLMKYKLPYIPSVVTIGFSFLALMGWAGNFCQIYVSECKVPMKLFQVNAYPKLMPSLRIWHRNVRRRWGRWWLCISLVGPLLVGLLNIGTLLFSFILGAIWMLLHSATK